MLYEIRYETKTGSGTRMVRATSDGEALERFNEAWLLYGDDVPSAWIVARWTE